MNEKTKSDYRKLCKHFIKTKFGDKTVTIDDLIQALQNAAPFYQRAYWRRLRNAIAFVVEQDGHIAEAKLIRLTRNPESISKSSMTTSLKRVPNQKRSKGITNEQYMTLIDAAFANEDGPLASAIFIAKTLGCRTNEISGVRVLNDDRVFIPGSKKTEGGDRGLDRILRVDHETWLDLQESIEVLAGEPITKTSVMEKLRIRLNTLSRNLFYKKNSRSKKSQNLPTFYSFRHQMGSELKHQLELLEQKELDDFKQNRNAGNNDVMDIDRSRSRIFRMKMAYIMGHQSTESIEKYGDRRKSGSRGSGGFGLESPIEADVTDDEIFDLVREKHKPLPFSSQDKGSNHNDSNVTKKPKPPSSSM